MDRRTLPLPRSDKRIGLLSKVMPLLEYGSTRHMALNALSVITHHGGVVARRVHRVPFRSVRSSGHRGRRYGGTLHGAPRSAHALHYIPIEQMRDKYLVGVVSTLFGTMYYYRIANSLLFAV